MPNDVSKAARKRLAQMGINKTASSKRQAAKKVGRYGAGIAPKAPSGIKKPRLEKRLGPR